MFLDLWRKSFSFKKNQIRPLG